MGCMLLLFVDRTHLLGKYGGILSGATGKDGNEGIFHVAFAVIDNETDDNWTWFLTTLGEALYGESDYEEVIIFISDRSKGLVNAVVRMFPSSPHGYCLRHLEANFMKANGRLGKALKEQCWVVIVKIAYVYASKEFNDVVSELVAISTNAHDWFKLMNMLSERREVSAMWDTYLCPEKRKKVEQIIESSRYLRVGRSSDDTYEVVDDHNSAINPRCVECSAGDGKYMDSV
ncbi:uncharacterized protein LOC120258735 [Dioscorea cayenensis subsp. rotundata]|uniref:Uncharacterized protein LOC120258735 n=1 Tax=Dioscorea cayennensis subsp. rotundata TaxID=55577 RepID=A0AB40B4B6_DIOCR|nr:uncharacterized protein LOC120258735 [Dioscorea cayenensis subsp. rotundata]